MKWLKPVYFLVKCPFPWRLGSLFQLWLAGRYTGRQADIWDYCARLPASGNENYSPSDFHRTELLDVALHTRHETGSASQCLFNSASHMHLWAQWVPWPLALHTAKSETGISNFTSTNGKAGVFLFVFFFFSNLEAKLFIIVRQPLTPLPEEKPVLNHFQCHTVFVCLFVFLSRSVSETNRSDDRLFSWGLPKGKKRKHWGMSQGWLKCYRCYLAHVIRGKGVSADIASVSQWTPFIPESQLMLLDGGRTACLQSASGNREKPPDIPNSDEGSPNDQVTEVTVRSTNVRKFLRMYFWSKWNKCTYLLLI